MLVTILNLRPKKSTPSVVSATKLFIKRLIHRLNLPIFSSSEMKSRRRTVINGKIGSYNFITPGWTQDEHRILDNFISHELDAGKRSANEIANVIATATVLDRINMGEILFKMRTR